MLLLNIGIEDTLLLQVVRHGVLRQKGSLEPDLSSNPLSFGMGSVGWVVASASAAELRAEIGTLNLIELPDLAPGRVPDGSSNVNLESQDRHTRW